MTPCFSREGLETEITGGAMSSTKRESEITSQNQQQLANAIKFFFDVFIVLYYNHIHNMTCASMELA